VTYGAHCACMPARMLSEKLARQSIAFVLNIRVGVQLMTNISAGLAGLGHAELGLGWSAAAVRLAPFGKPVKALYRAGKCCADLGQPAAALHYLWQARFCFSRTSACGARSLRGEQVLM
jgi:hypothetical protein